MCVAGIDPTGGAGLDADKLTAAALGAKAVCVETALARQDAKGLRKVIATESGQLAAKVEEATRRFPDAPVKIGMLPNAPSIKALAKALTGHKGPVIADPVMGPSAGGRWAGKRWLVAYRQWMPTITTMVTPNLAEARELANLPDGTAQQCAATLNSMGFGIIVITGGDTACDDGCTDLIYAGGLADLLVTGRVPGTARGTGCAHSTAICAALARGECLSDALVIGVMHTREKIEGTVTGWPSMRHMPRLYFGTESTTPQVAPNMAPIGFCPIVDSPEKVASMAAAGAHTVQLRIKHMRKPDLARAIGTAAQTAKKTNTALIVNDHWQEALRQNGGKIAGVHLGQTDLRHADTDAIRSAGLALGISANGWAEAARAASLNPSYLSFGPVFKTRSKPNAKRTIGIMRLGRLTKGLDTPFVAIGGITAGHLERLAKLGVSGFATIAASATKKGARQLARAWVKAQKSASG